MAVLRHLIARLSAETGDFQAGMKAAKDSLSSVRIETLDAHKAFERQMASLRRQGEVFKAAALEADFLTQQEQKAAWATSAHARHAQALTGIIEEMAAAERASVAITNSATVARTRAGFSFGNAAKNLKTFGTLLKGGGVLLGAKLILGALRHWGEAVLSARKQFNAGEIDIHEMNLEMGKAIPIAGDLISAWDAIGEGMGAAREEAKQNVREQEELLRLTQELRIARAETPEERARIEADVKRQRENMELGKKFRDQNRRENARKINEELKAISDANAEREETNKLIKEQVKLSRGAWAEELKSIKERQREQRKREIEGRKRWQSRFGAVGDWLTNDAFSGVKQRLSVFEATRDLVKSWLGGGDRAGSSRAVPQLSGAAFGSSSAANAIARSTGSVQAKTNMLLTEIRDAVKRNKPGVVVARDL